ncbi:hypothetical protein G6F35_011595 [Rhizopus arrhizus]|nr:hypothetical protein G6F35_011595 [Rhizopus arrhizus]
MGVNDDEFELIRNHVPSLISLCGESKHECGYCKGKDCSKSFGIWAHFMSCSNYQSLIDRGWRRSGKYLYKPDMERTCCPQYTIRLKAKEFKLTKGQKKILSKFNRYIQGTWSPDKDHQEKENNTKKPPKDNTPKQLMDYIHALDNSSNNKHDLKIEIEPSSFTKEKFELYKKYQISIHNDDDVSERGFRRFLVDSPLKREKKFGSFHQKYLLDGQLIALSVIDILPSCVSAVYFMYDPQYAYLGLGKYSALRETSLVQELSKTDSNLQYYYMGFYIDSCPKMNYKGQYEPSDLLDPLDYTWHPIEKFKKEFKHKKFITFVETRPKLNITDQVLSTMRM